MMGLVIDIAGDIIDEVAYDIIDKVACNVNARLAKRVFDRQCPRSEGLGTNFTLPARFVRVSRRNGDAAFHV